MPVYTILLRKSDGWEHLGDYTAASAEVAVKDANRREGRYLTLDEAGSVLAFDIVNDPKVVAVPWAEARQRPVTPGR